MQTKIYSVIETATNVLSGFLIAQLLILYLLPCWNFEEITIKDSLLISAIFTIISFIRGFACRRLFNRKEIH